jgi:transcriptional regulator with XRE-family HTH domain
MNARADQHGERLIGFSTRLRQLLAQRGHTLVPAQLARDFTFSTSEQRATAQTFSNWLNGVQLPRTHTFHALAEWLHTTPEYLAEGIPVLHFAPTKHTDFDTQQLVDHFQQLDPYGRRVALTLVAGLARLKGGAA